VLLGRLLPPSFTTILPLLLCPQQWRRTSLSRPVSPIQIGWRKATMLGIDCFSGLTIESANQSCRQLTAASLVALQSVPGLVVLYAGWVKHKWAINSAFMAFYAFGAVLICWMLWGYKTAFGEQMLPFVGSYFCTFFEPFVSNHIQVAPVPLSRWITS
jgi:hypothetical protein